MYVGLDVHKKICYGTVMDEKGKVVKQAKFTNDHEALDEFMEGLDEALVAMEAGYCWQLLYDRLEESGHHVKLAHPLKVKAIAEAKARDRQGRLRDPDTPAPSRPAARELRASPGHTGAT